MKKMMFARRFGFVAVGSGGALGDRALPTTDGALVSPERSEHCEAMSLEVCDRALPSN